MCEVWVNDCIESGNPEDMFVSGTNIEYDVTNKIYIDELLTKKCKLHKKDIILLKMVAEGYSYNEIGKIIDKTRNNVAMRLTILRRKLAKAAVMK